MCEARGEVTTAVVVDHIEPHRGDQRLFWDTDNWQPLCEPHHNSTKQREEHRGFGIGSDLRGRPLDPKHPWNRA
ncbi:HNH endonuclease signature motif containing protein [Ancylobacter oerskovii]|nr:HNH endonuclease signature motif containing protein [Ancylobacter oerskovii]